MTHSEQLERETEQTRAEFERTLDELRDRITPGQVVDQFVNYARGGTAGTFVRNLGQRTVDNPLPLLMIGAGLTWLMVANGGSSGHAERRIGDGGEHGSGKIGRMFSAAADAASGVGERAASAAGRVAGAARSAADKARSARSTAGDFTHHSRDRMEGMSHDLASGARGTVGYLREHPFVLVGLGLAIGAAIGAAFPPSDSEDRLVGDRSDAFKDRVSDAAATAREEARTVFAEAGAAGGVAGAGPEEREGNRWGEDESPGRTAPYTPGATPV